MGADSDQRGQRAAVADRALAATRYGASVK